MRRTISMLTTTRPGIALAKRPPLTIQHRRRGFAWIFITALTLLAGQNLALAENGLAYDQPSPDRENRRVIAHDLETTFDGLDKQIPTLSPS